tara:strand:+ start:4851 stop:6605 length:1755 start_codon:yes stop_codon:yes gene_type:complete
MPIKSNSIQVIFDDFYPIEGNSKKYILVLSKASQYLNEIIDVTSQPKGGNGFKLNLCYAGYYADISFLPKQELELFNTLKWLYHDYEKTPLTTFFRLPVSADALQLAVNGQEQITIRNYKSIILLILTSAATSNALTKDDVDNLEKLNYRINALEKAIFFINMLTDPQPEDKVLIETDDKKSNSLHVIVQKLKVKIESTFRDYVEMRQTLEQSQYTTRLVKNLSDITAKMKNFELFYIDALRIRQINKEEIVDKGTYSDSKAKIDYYWTVVKTCLIKLRNNDEHDQFFNNQYTEYSFASVDERIILYMMNHLKDKKVLSNLTKKEAQDLIRVNRILGNHLGLQSDEQKLVFIRMIFFDIYLPEELFKKIIQTKALFPEAIIKKITSYNSNVQFSGKIYQSSIKSDMAFFYGLFLSRYHSLQKVAVLTEKLVHSVGALGIVKLKTAINDIFLKKLADFLCSLTEISERVLYQLASRCQGYNSKQDEIRVRLYQDLFKELNIQSIELLKNIHELNLIYNTDKIIVKVQAEALENLNNFMAAVDDLLDKNEDVADYGVLRAKLLDEHKVLSHDIKGEQVLQCKKYCN